MVDHEAYVGLVDAHAERDRRDNHEKLAALPPVLDCSLVAVGEARVKVARTNAKARAEVTRDVFAVAAAQAVDDAALARVRRAHELGDALERRTASALRLDAVREVRAIKRLSEHDRVAHAELRLDVFDRVDTRGSSQRHDWNARELLAQPVETHIVRPEVVPPLVDAVRLVNHEAREPARTVQVLEHTRREPCLGNKLGCDIEQANLELRLVQLGTRKLAVALAHLARDRKRRHAQA